MLELPQEGTRVQGPSSTQARRSAPGTRSSCEAHDEQSGHDQLLETVQDAEDITLATILDAEELICLTTRAGKAVGDTGAALMVIGTKALNLYKEFALRNPKTSQNAA